MEQAAGMLASEGFAPSLLARYSPQDMLAQAESDMLSAGVLGSIGQDLNLVQAYRAPCRACRRFAGHIASVYQGPSRRSP